MYVLMYVCKGTRHGGKLVSGKKLCSGTECSVVSAFRGIRRVAKVLDGEYWIRNWPRGYFQIIDDSRPTSHPFQKFEAHCLNIAR